MCVCISSVCTRLLACLKWMVRYRRKPEGEISSKQHCSIHAQLPAKSKLSSLGTNIRPTCSSQKTPLLESKVEKKKKHKYNNNTTMLSYFSVCWWLLIPAKWIYGWEKERGGVHFSLVNVFPWYFADSTIMFLSTALLLPLVRTHPVSSSDSHLPLCPSGHLINGSLSKRGCSCWDDGLRL